MWIVCLLVAATKHIIINIAAECIATSQNGTAKMNSPIGTKLQL